MNKVTQQNILGNEFVWWMGVVENRIDPLNLGRCQVRIFGRDTDSLQLIPTEKLPWAQPIIPTNGTLTTGTPQEGDYAFGFFLDGASKQMAVIMGVFPGIPQEHAANNKGFFDQRKNFDSVPRKPIWSSASRSEDTPSKQPMIIGEPTTSRLSRNEKTANTIVAWKKGSITKNVESASVTWSEPSTGYNPVSPYNRVTETESGHIMEFDDTRGAERVHIAHRMGTFFEIYSDGKQVTKVVSDNYTLILGSNYINVKGTCNITVDGNVNLTAGGDVNGVIKGKADLNISGETNLTTEKLTVNGDIELNGNMHSSGDIVADTVSLQNHIHRNVQSGSSVSGPPVA